MYSDLRRQVLGATWIDAEELAYNIPLAQSARRGRVRMPDGTLHLVRLGVPDTFWTIPARGKWLGKTVSGFVSVKDTDQDDGEFWFTIPKTYRNPSPGREG